MVDVGGECFSLSLEKEFFFSYLVKSELFAYSNKESLAFKERLNSKWNAIDIETVKKLSFVLTLFFSGLFLDNPAVDLNGLLLGLNSGIISHSLCATENQIVAGVGTIFYAVICSTKAYLLCLVKVYCCNFFGILHLINCELRLPRLLQILYFYYVALNINIPLCFSFL